MSDHTGAHGAQGADEGTPHRAGAFDIRNFIAALIGVYGVVLIIAGIVGPTDAELERADGLNINLFAGIGMVLVSLAFAAWARLRPVVVAEPTDTADGTSTPTGH